MADPTIACPHCSGEIRLTESLAAPLIAAERQTLARERAALTEARAGVDAEIATRLEALRASVSATAATEARAEAAAALKAQADRAAALAEALRQRDAKLAEAQAAQADALRRTRELDEARRELELTVEKRVGTALAAVRDKARAEAEEALQLKVLERETQIAAMARQIEELRRRSEQGSQQLQGEVLELRLEEMLRSRFPGDLIEPVAKGVCGADVLQRVTGGAGTPCGSIVWETKRTQHWTDGWLPKFREDQRATGAEIAVLVSQALPKGVERFAQVDGVWVSDWASALPLAVALRQTLVEVQAARLRREGEGTKMELVYDYLTGPRFRHRVEAIVERFSEMSADLDRERKAMTRLWAKRELQIQGVIELTVGLYGDLQGIAGTAMAAIEGLELPLLEEPGAA